MKLLFITQKIDKDDDILGIYHRWAEELAKRVDKMAVICLYRGRIQLPGNVEVYSLGKEKGAQRLTYLVNFYKYIWKLRNDYDRVFVHMNPEYMILGGWLWKLLGKKILFWYAHYLATWRLRIAAIFADRIVTSTRLAYPLPSRKLEVLQQGIDTEKFKPLSAPTADSKFKILFLGRIAPIKNLDVLIRAFEIVQRRLPDASLTVVGNPGPKDQEYHREIFSLIRLLNLENKIIFQPAIPNYRVPEIYHHHDLFINLTPTGSFDKTTLEAMACGLPAFVSNKAFREIFSENLANKFMFREKDSSELAKKVLDFVNSPLTEKNQIRQVMRDLIVAKYRLPDLMTRLVDAIQSL